MSVAVKPLPVIHSVTEDTSHQCSGHCNASLELLASNSRLLLPEQTHPVVLNRFINCPLKLYELYTITDTL